MHDVSAGKNWIPLSPPPCSASSSRLSLAGHHPASSCASPSNRHLSTIITTCHLCRIQAAPDIPDQIQPLTLLMHRLFHLFQCKGSVALRLCRWTVDWQLDTPCPPFPSLPCLTATISSRLFTGSAFCKISLRSLSIRQGPSTVNSTNELMMMLEISFQSTSYKS